MIAVSPFSKGGHISHVYAEHSSFVKFVERNWKLGVTLSGRSRDNLPNPRQRRDDEKKAPALWPGRQVEGSGRPMCRPSASKIRRRWADAVISVTVRRRRSPSGVAPKVLPSHSAISLRSVALRSASLNELSARMVRNMMPAGTKLMCG